jgi:thiamine-monophosphate kinase
MTLRQIGEEKLLAQILPALPVNGRVVLPAGDDCAVVRFPGARDLLVLKSDCVVEGLHFKNDAPASAIGWKAMMRALSDFGGMAAVPEFALVTLVIPPQKRLTWVRALYRGLSRAAAHFNVAMVGGETSETRGALSLTVSVAGRVEAKRWVARKGAKANDDLFVTGQLGGSIRRRHLQFIARIAEARWLTQHFAVHAMMDLSDGLGADLPRLARAGNLSFSIDENALPLTRGCTIAQAISDGEDYELLFAIPPRERERLQRSWKNKFPKLKLTRIGKLIPHSALRVPRLLSGYVHFTKHR